MKKLEENGLCCSSTMVIDREYIHFRSRQTILTKYFIAALIFGAVYLIFLEFTKHSVNIYLVFLLFFSTIVLLYNLGVDIQARFSNEEKRINYSISRCGFLTRHLINLDNSTLVLRVLNAEFSAPEKLLIFSNGKYYTLIAAQSYAFGVPVKLIANLRHLCGLKFEIQNRFWRFW